ncbi:MAG: type II toxin-antitoxin system RelE/ParE family toxin [Gammaproteobacteria bacterium]|nr:type II toxin-antitoxin system RelE/ParE family toxin [Gammaproteobacteria bacterium]
MSRYQVVFSATALRSLREVARYIADDAGSDRARNWLATIKESTATLEAHPQAFPVVGRFEGEAIHARFVLRHVLYYFIDESAHVVILIDIVHTARATVRQRYEEM